ncbi:MAG: hypothetical protein ACR2GH_06310, partial [Pseudonocardia sp.]
MSSGNADFRAFRSSMGTHLFVVDGSRIYDLPEVDGPLTDEQLWSAVGLLGSGPPRIDGSPLTPPAVSAISLNVMQACNMSCRYCYADEGRFGGRPRSMGQHVARAGVGRLPAHTSPGVEIVPFFSPHLTLPTL